MRVSRVNLYWSYPNNYTIHYHYNYIQGGGVYLNFLCTRKLLNALPFQFHLVRCVSHRSGGVLCEDRCLQEYRVNRF